MCSRLFAFILTKNDFIMHFNKFPNLGVYHANFPNLKGPRAPSQNCKKNKTFQILDKNWRGA